MADLDTLRPEVREAVEYLDAGGTAWIAKGSWGCIRAELLRLATRNAELEAKATRDHDWISDLLAENKKAEAELAALKALLRECEPIISAYAESLHLTDGFRRRPHECDGLAEQVRALVKVEE